MESFLETLNLIHFEKLDYEYTVESLIIDINKLNTQQDQEKDLKNRKNEKEKNKIDKKKDNAKTSNKQKSKKKKTEEKEKDTNLFKQSANMSIFVVPNVKKNPNYDLQLSQLDKLNKSKIKNVKKNDFDKIKKILSANNISMNINKASKAIQEMKAKENKNKQHQQHQKTEKDKDKRAFNESENFENAENKNIFTNTVTNFIESEEVIDTANPENQIKNSDVVLNEDNNNNNNLKNNEAAKNQSNKSKQSTKETKAENNKEQQKTLSDKQDKNKSKNAVKGTKKDFKEKENLPQKKEESTQQKQTAAAAAAISSKQTEKEKPLAQQTTQNKRVDDFIKNLKEKKLTQAKASEPQQKQFLKQSFYEKNKFLFILDPTQRLRLRDPSANLNKDVLTQFFELVNLIFGKFDFCKEANDESEIEFMRQNIKEYNVLVDNLMEICENKNDVLLTLFTAESYISHVRSTFANFIKKNDSFFFNANFILVKSLLLNCVYSALKFFANMLSEANELKAANNEEYYTQVFNSALKLLESISLHLIFFCEENEKNLIKHVDLLESCKVLGKEGKEDAAACCEKNVADYLNSFGANKSLSEYNFKEDQNLNFYLLMKVILFASMKNVSAIKKAFYSACGKQQQEASLADSANSLNLNSFFLYGITNANKTEISDKNLNFNQSKSAIGKLISLFANSIASALLKPNKKETKTLEVKTDENTDLIELESKKKIIKKQKNPAAISSSIDFSLFSQFLSCLKFFTKLNLSFETHKNKIQNLMITVSKLIVSVLNEIKAIFLNTFANEFYMTINKLIQIYIQNFKELYEANESSYNEISDLINLAIEENSNLNNSAAANTFPFSLSNKNFDYECISKKIFENFDFVNLDLNYFLDDLARNYLQITIKYLKIAEKGLRFDLSAKPVSESIWLKKTVSNFNVLAFLDFFNKILLCIINLKSHNLKPIYFKIISKSLENYIPASSSTLKPINSIEISQQENTELLVKYVLWDLRNFIKNTFRNSTSKNILKNLKNVRETIHFYSSFPSIKKQAIEFIDNPYLFDNEGEKANANYADISNISTVYIENSICILMLLNFFEFNNNNKNENNDLKLFKEYFEIQRKLGNENCFDYISKFEKKLCYYYLNNYVDSELKNLEIIKDLIYLIKNESKKINQYELILGNLNSLIFNEQNDKIQSEKVYYQKIFNELKAFDNILILNIKQYSSSDLKLANEHNKEIINIVSLVKSFITSLLFELRNVKVSLKKETEILIKNTLNEKTNIIESLIVYFINKKHILLQVFPDTNNLKATETNLETCEFYDEILLLITSEKNISNTSSENKLQLKFDIMHEIKINNENLISKALTLKQSNKQYPNKIKSKSDLFEYLIQILKLESLLKESEQAEKTKAEINLGNNKPEAQEDILIESEADDINSINFNAEEIQNKEVIREAEKINVIETLEKMNNQVSSSSNSSANQKEVSSAIQNTQLKPAADNYNNFSSVSSYKNQNQADSLSQIKSEKEKQEQETIANLDLILKLFIEYFDVITNELTKGIELKFPAKSSSSALITNNSSLNSQEPLLEKALFNLINYLESITILLKNDTFFKSFVKNLDLLETFLKKFLQIKDLCTETSKKITNGFKSMQSADMKIIEYNLIFIQDSLALSELTEKLIFLASDALKNKFKNYLIYIFGEAELYKHLMVKDLESIQSVGNEMELFYKKSIFEQSKINRFLKRIQDEENDYLEDVMLEIYSKEAIKYLEYPEEVIDMLSNVNEAVQNDFKISTKDFYNCVFPYFYVWKTIMSKIEYGFKLFTSDKKYVEDLDNYKMLLKFNINYFERNTKLYNTFCLVVVSLLHILDEDRHLIEKKGNLLNFENFDESELLGLGEKMDNKVLFEFILNLLYKFVKIFPSLVKYYYDQLQGRLKSVFRSLITNMILPKMLTHLKTKIDSNKVNIFFLFFISTFFF